MIARLLVVLTAAFLVNVDVSAQQPAPAAVPTAPALRAVMLGSGSPGPDPRRMGPSVAIVFGGRAYLVDAGAGVVRRASLAMELGVPELDPRRLDLVLLTHLHSDHTVGLPDLQLTPWVMGRPGPLRLLGPPGTADMARHLQAAYRADVETRVNGLEQADPAGARIAARDIGPGVVLREGALTVTAFRVDHGSFEHAYGYRFDTPDRSIVISGDTTRSPSLIEAAKGCDVLIHEAYVEQGWQGLGPAGRAYHASFHTSAVDLGKLAAKVGPSLVVVYHPLLFGASTEALRQEVKRHFSGRVVVANDLDLF